jgi:hypothetical protein
MRRGGGEDDDDDVKCLVDVILQPQKLITINAKTAK